MWWGDVLLPALFKTSRAQIRLLVEKIPARVSVTRVLQECYKSVTRELQGSYKGAVKWWVGCYEQTNVKHTFSYLRFSKAVLAAHVAENVTLVCYKSVRFFEAVLTAHFTGILQKISNMLHIHVIMAYDSSKHSSLHTSQEIPAGLVSFPCSST
jgi:hypothetical protein